MERNHLTTPRGEPAFVITREDTSDLSLAGSFFHLWGKLDDEYGLADLRVDGVFVDIGAHIGLVTLAVLLDNPGATAICVEPLEDNLAVLRQNLLANGVLDRATILQAAIGTGDEVAVPYGLGDDSPIHGERFIGGLKVAEAQNTSVATVPSVTLSALVEMAGGSIDTLKIDCEGCEWQAFTDPAVAQIRQIFGEWHGHPTRKNSVTVLRTMLGKTHAVTILREFGGMGTFRAVRGTVSPLRGAA